MIDYDPTGDADDAVRAAIAIVAAVKADDQQTAVDIALDTPSLMRAGIIAFLASLAATFTPDDEFRELALRNARREAL